MLRNIGALVLYQVPCMALCVTTKVRHAAAFTHVALFAALVLPLLHGVASLVAGGAARRRGRHELGAGLTRSGWIIVTIWCITWILLLVLSNR